MEVRKFSLENVRVYVDGVPVGDPLNVEFKEQFPGVGSALPNGEVELWAGSIPIPKEEWEKLRKLQKWLTLDNPPESPHKSACAPPADPPRTDP